MASTTAQNEDTTTSETPLSPILSQQDQDQQQTQPAAATKTTFPHRTLSAAPLHPFIDTATPAINPDDPVELDGTPTSPAGRLEREESGSATATATGLAAKKGGDVIFSPGVHDEVMRELLGSSREEDGGGDGDAGEGAGGGEGEGRKRKGNRAALLSERSKDPAVLVDIPQTPGAEEILIASRVSREGSAASS